MGSQTAGDALLWPLLRKQAPTKAFDGPQEATVVAATADTLTFTVNGYSPTVKFGPAPYPRPAVAATTLTLSSGTVSPDPHTHTPSVPPAGTQCLVMFVGSGTDRPWVVAFASWP